MTPHLLALTAGAVAWLAVALGTGRAEAWDSPLYFTVALPVMALAAAILGWRWPAGAWRWGALMMVAQLLLLLATAGDFGLLPLGIVLFVILALPVSAAGAIAGWLARRRRRTP